MQKDREHVEGRRWDSHHRLTQMESMRLESWVGKVCYRPAGLRSGDEIQTGGCEGQEKRTAGVVGLVRAETEGS